MSSIFNELNISEEIKRALSDMGIQEATPVQQMSIQPIIDGNDLVAQAPTGTGKTFAFGIPLIECTTPGDEEVTGLILCPTRELCMQTSDELKKLAKYKEGIRIVPIYGGQDFKRQLFSLKRRPQIIVATPGRLMDHMRRHTIHLDNLKFMVLDEADEMLNMGFREDIDTILKSVPEERQITLFSATISPDIMSITKKYQKDAVSVKVERQELESQSIDQYYITVKSGKKFEALTGMIDSKDYKPCMVFCNTKRMVDRLTEQLVASGYRADSIHGDMRQPQRDKVMGKFKRHIVDILVATDVAARGIDINGIEAVFNYDLPDEDEYYIHRIGRTGRADKTGVSYSLVQSGKMGRLKEIMKYAHCTVKPYKAPSPEEAENVRLSKTLDGIKEIINSGEHSKYIETISKYIEQSGGETTALDIAAAFMKQSDTTTDIEFTDEEKAPRERNRRERKQPDEDSVRLFINVGTLDKIGKRSMLDLFQLYSTIDVRTISAIDIFDKYSFVNVPLEEAESVVTSLNGEEFKERTIAIEIARPEEKKRQKKIRHYSRKKTK